MKKRQIIMRDWEVRAIREGRKTQLRRLVKQFIKPSDYEAFLQPDQSEAHLLKLAKKCTLGRPGDGLWVKEAFALTQYKLPVYRADARDRDGKLWPSVHSDPNGVLWTPSIHMPRWASRITLEIVSVRAQRLQDITEEDAKAEGVCPEDFTGKEHPDYPVLSVRQYRAGFEDAWEFMHGPGSWERNDFVFAVEFKEVKP